MKSQILFSGKNKKNIISLLSAEIAQSVVKVIDNFFNFGQILMKYSPKCRVMFGVEISQWETLKRQGGGRNGPTPLCRAS